MTNINNSYFRHVCHVHTGTSRDNTGNIRTDCASSSTIEESKRGARGLSDKTHWLINTDGLWSLLISHLLVTVINKNLYLWIIFFQRLCPHFKLASHLRIVDDSCWHWYLRYCEEDPKSNSSPWRFNVPVQHWPSPPIDEECSVPCTTSLK